MSSRPRKPVKEGASPDASISAVSEKTSSSLISSPDEGRNQRVTRRTGIQAATPGKVPLEAGTVFEDVDAFFQSSRRPALTSQNDEQQKRDRDNKTTSSEREGLQNSDDDTSKGNTSSSNRSRSDRQQQRQQEKEANSRQYQQHVAKLTEPTFDIFKSNVTADDKRSEETTAESAKSSKYMQRIIMTQKNRNSSHLNIPQSPSELSHATTIPPTPASKASATKSILRSATGGKGQVEATTSKDGTPFSAASDKSVRWNVDEDNSDELPEDESESQLQGSGKKEMNIGNQGETDDLYPNDDDDDDDNISGLFVTRPSPSATLNTSLDRAAALLPVPNSEMKRKATGSSSDDDRSPTPLEDSMAEMLNNTDDTIHDNEDKEGGGSSHGRNADATGSDLASGEEPDDYGNQHHDDDDDDEDDDKEGEAFAFASHDSNDPDDENMDRRTKQSKVPATDKETRPAKRRGRTTKSKASPVSPESPRNASENKKKQKKSKKQSAKYATPPGFKGHAVGNRDYETVPVTDYQDDEEEDDDGNVRRSKRARFKPLEYWRNEKLVYEAHHETGVLGEALGHMPVVTGVVRALPTPHARRKANRKAESDTESDEDDEKIKKKGKKKKASKSSESDEYDSSNLRKKYEINDSDRGLIWSEGLLDVCETQIVSYYDPERFVNLPTIRARSKTESKVSGKAVQSFNAPTMSGRICGWLSGLVNLPPSAIKDAEGVGSCLQHFHVIECQPKALEFALANPEDGDGMFQNENAQRFLLSKGDAFYVPPGNVYRLENHSDSEGCILSYTIFRPFPENTAAADKKGKR